MTKLWFDMFENITTFGGPEEQHFVLDIRVPTSHIDSDGNLWEGVKHLPILEIGAACRRDAEAKVAELLSVLPEGSEAILAAV